jgi:hypothetical protein
MAIPKAPRPGRVLLAGALLWAIAPSAASSQQQLSLYGYMATRYEKTFSEPGFAAGSIVKQSAPGEFTYPSFNLMLSQQVGPRFKAYINLGSADAGTLAPRNMWGEVSLSRLFSVRFGKTYRRFGLYNEILDAVPTYYGIEPPEMFDKDHLFLSRTTALMVLGSVDVGPGTLAYSASNDNGEGDVFDNAFPLGFDVNYTFGYGTYKVGVSGYRSGGPANSDVSVGDGSPATGVLPWMAEDHFSVWDGYAQMERGPLTVQFEYAQANHAAERDPGAVLDVLAGASLNDAQLARFLVNPAGSRTSPANVNTVADFTVKTWYVRGGYSVETSLGEVAPYVQWDWYSNPETIAQKKFGGDNEAGVADDGVFNKATAGIVYRPTPAVAVKLDSSQHRYLFHGSRVTYPEIRLDVSYTFGF